MITSILQWIRSVLPCQRRTNSISTPVRAEILNQALAKFPETARTIYLLHARDEVPLTDIARRLELSPTEVEAHLVSALVQLDRHIGPNSSGTAVAERRGHG